MRDKLGMPPLWLLMLLLTSGAVVGQKRVEEEEKLMANSKRPTQELPRPLTVPRELSDGQGQRVESENENENERGIPAPVDPR
ncbi:hypothetical protein ACLKA6_014293 [Drosophila palustris]